MKKRNKSILQANMNECYVCKATHDLHTHEVFYGEADRRKSIEYDCYVRLCARHHNMSNEGVHFNKRLDLDLKAEMQKAFERMHGHDKFMSVFHHDWINVRSDWIENKSTR